MDHYPSAADAERGCGMLILAGLASVVIDAIIVIVVGWQIAVAFLAACTLIFLLLIRGAGDEPAR